MTNKTITAVRFLASAIATTFAFVFTIAAAYKSGETWVWLLGIGAGCAATNNWWVMVAVAIDVYKERKGHKDRWETFTTEIKGSRVEDND